MGSKRASHLTFFGVSALLFAGSAAVTTLWGASMSSMGEMPMPGGWTVSMAAMWTLGHTWRGAATMTSSRDCGAGGDAGGCCPAARAPG